MKICISAIFLTLSVFSCGKGKNDESNASKKAPEAVKSTAPKAAAAPEYIIVRESADGKTTEMRVSSIDASQLTEKTIQNAFDTKTTPAGKIVDELDNVSSTESCWRMYRRPWCGGGFCGPAACAPVCAPVCAPFVGGFGGCGLFSSQYYSFVSAGVSTNFSPWGYFPGVGGYNYYSYRNTTIAQGGAGVGGIGGPIGPVGPVGPVVNPVGPVGGPGVGPDIGVPGGMY